MVEISGPPAVNFYSMLSGLGDQIVANRQQANRQAALTAVTQPGVSYGDAMRGLIATGDLQGAQMFANLQAHKDVLDRQAAEDAHRTAREAVEDKFRQAQLDISRSNADKTPSGFAADPQHPGAYIPIPGGPQDPNYLRDRAKAENEAAVGKPIPFETLSGTRFLVRQPDGSYSTVNPATIGSPAPVSPPQAIPSGPSATPAVAPAAASPAQAAAAAPPAPSQADLDAVDPTTGRRENWLKSQPPDVQAYIKKIADYEVDPRTTSIKGGHREQVMSAVAQYDPTYDQNTFGSRAKAIKDFSTGQQGNAIRSFDVAIDHLDTLQRYSDALKSGDVRLINSLRNKWMTETGSDLPTNVQAVAPIVGAEVSKAIIGSNNALADREELRKPLQIANSPEQISGAIQGYKTLMAGQLKGLKKQYEDTTGKKDFNSRIRDNTRNVLLGDGSSSGSSSSSSQPNVTSTGVKWSIQ